MRTLRERRDFEVTLELDPCVDEVLVEDATLEQVLVVVLERLQRRFKRSGKLRDRLCLLRRELVEVLVDRLDRLDAVLDTVKNQVFLTS